MHIYFAFTDSGLINFTSVCSLSSDHPDFVVLSSETVKLTACNEINKNFVQVTAQHIICSSFSLSFVLLNLIYKQQRLYEIL